MALINYGSNTYHLFSSMAINCGGISRLTRAGVRIRLRLAPGSKRWDCVLLPYITPLMMDGTTLITWQSDMIVFALEILLRRMHLPVNALSQLLGNGTVNTQICGYTFLA